MNNDPERDPGLFAGKRRLYYGRWDYKYEMAAEQRRRGRDRHPHRRLGRLQLAGGAELVDGRAAQPAGRPGEPVLPLKAWATEDASRRIARLGGHDLDALRAAAESRDFRPVPLGVRLSAVLSNEVVRRTSANVIGDSPGSDPALAKEAVVYTAHHDHLGIKAEAAGRAGRLQRRARQRPGVATLLAMAEAFAALPERPRRSILFAAVTAEEQGLLGSQYLARHLPLPAGPRRRQRQHRRHQHLGPHRRRPGDRPRQVLARRLDPRDRRDAGTQGRARGLPGQGLLLPLRPPELRAARRARGLPGGRHRGARQAARLGPRAAGRPGRRRTTTSPRTISRPSGTSRARSRTPGCCSCWA